MKFFKFYFYLLLSLPVASLTMEKKPSFKSALTMQIEESKSNGSWVKEAPIPKETHSTKRFPVKGQSVKHSRDRHNNIHIYPGFYIKKIERFMTPEEILIAKANEAQRQAQLPKAPFLDLSLSKARRYFLWCYYTQPR